MTEMGDADHSDPTEELEYLNNERTLRPGDMVTTRLLASCRNRSLRLHVMVGSSVARVSGNGEEFEFTLADDCTLEQTAGDTRTIATAFDLADADQARMLFCMLARGYAMNVLLSRRTGQVRVDLIVYGPSRLGRSHYYGGSWGRLTLRGTLLNAHITVSNSKRKAVGDDGGSFFEASAWDPP